MLFFDSKVNGKKESPEMLATRDALLSKVREINGKTVGEVDTTHYLSNPKNKGRIGQVVQIYLGKEPDNDAGADFPEAGVELKVAGLISGKRGYRAKERLVLHMIDYKKDHDISFEESGLLKKCDTMLITTYQYLPSGQKGVLPDYASFPIVDSFVYKLSDKDIAVMKNDYDAIMDKINSGRAEELSESDTEYLAACTKGVNGDQRVTQYNSDVLAKPRAFSLKSSFLTSIIKKCMGEDVSRTLSLRKSNQASLESASLFWATSIPGMEGLNRSSRRGSQTSRIQKANTQTMFPGCWA